MERVNTSTKNMSKYAGKWVAIDPQKDRIIAVGLTLKDISPLVSGNASSKNKIVAASFKAPRKDEGRYILVYPSPLRLQLQTEIV